MGFFSQDCIVCGHPALSEYAIDPGVNEWMTQVVAIAATGAIHAGTYDGYGRVDGAEYAIGEGATVYHQACWELAGKPTAFTVASPGSDDQGFFFDDPTHSMADPRLKTPPKRRR